MAAESFCCTDDFRRSSLLESGRSLQPKASGDSYVLLPLSSPVPTKRWRAQVIKFSVGATVVAVLLYIAACCLFGYGRLDTTKTPAMLYKDTTVTKFRPPKALLAASDWNYGVHHIESLAEDKDDDTQDDKDNHHGDLSFNLPTGFEIEGVTDQQGDYEFDRDGQPLITPRFASTHQDQNHVALNPGPRYYSAVTMKGPVGEKLMEEDDEFCHQAGRREYSKGECLPAPYLYVTYHGKSGNNGGRNVCKYTRDGCSMGSALMPSGVFEPVALRGMLLVNNFLFVTESSSEDSKLAKYSHCNPTLGHRRELLADIIASIDEKYNGLAHPYAFAQRAGDPYIYVSAQNTHSVLRYHHLSADPGPLPKALRDLSPELLAEGKTALKETHSDKEHQEQSQKELPNNRLHKSGLKLDKFYNGTFVDLGSDDVRGIAFDNQGLLYVADKQKGVLVYDKEGFLLGMLPFDIPNPISIHFVKDRSSIFVGSAGNDALYEFDASTWEMLQVIEHEKLEHPAGFVSHGDSLYVVSQGRNQLLEFSMVTGRLEDVVLDDLPDDGEDVILSPC